MQVFDISHLRDLPLVFHCNLQGVFGDSKYHILLWFYLVKVDKMTKSA